MGVTFTLFHSSDSDESVHVMDAEETKKARMRHVFNRLKAKAKAVNPFLARLQMVPYWNLLEQALIKNSPAITIKCSILEPFRRGYTPATLDR